MTSGFKLRWDAAEDDHLLFLRDLDRSTFREIGLRLGRSALACQARYYGPLGARNGANHYPAWHPLARRVDRSSSPAPAPLQPSLAGEGDNVG
jgi:hypothetical protein